MSEINRSRVVPVGDMRGEDAEETAELRGMFDSATNYLSSHSWCAGIVESYFGLGVGGIVAVFAYRIVPAREGVDDWVWVVVGDIPPAYITVDDAPTPAAALDGYIGAMQQWIEAAKEGRATDGLIPVNVPATPYWASKLESRIGFLDREILAPHLDELT